VDGFKKFLLRGNVVDLAVAVVIGAAFGAVVTRLVAAFITPLVGVATGATGDVSKKSFSAGGVEFPYGLFVQALLSFVVIAAVVYFFVVKPINRLMERYKTEPEVQTPTKQCPECPEQHPGAGQPLRLLHGRAAGGLVAVVGRDLAPQPLVVVRRGGLRLRCEHVQVGGGRRPGARWPDRAAAAARCGRALGVPSAAHARLPGRRRRGSALPPLRLGGAAAPAVVRSGRLRAKDLLSGRSGPTL